MTDQDTTDQDTIDITGLDPAAVLHALYHGTRPLGMGMLHNAPGFSIEDARAVLEDMPEHRGERRFDYVCGRPLKVRIGETTLSSVWLYDRDAGQGQAKRVIDRLRASQKGERAS
jgi:hypothetical protein